MEDVFDYAWRQISTRSSGGPVVARMHDHAKGVYSSFHFEEAFLTSVVMGRLRISVALHRVRECTRDVVNLLSMYPDVSKSFNGNSCWVHHAWSCTHSIDNQLIDDHFYSLANGSVQPLLAICSFVTRSRR